MSEHLTAAQALAQAAGQRATAAENQRDEAVRQARAEADQRVAAAGAERDAAIAQARADAEQRVRAADAEREKARQAAAAEDTARHAGKETARAAQDETGRVRADVGKMLGQVRAEAARERDELRADLRARAEGGEQRPRREPVRGHRPAALQRPATPRSPAPRTYFTGLGEQAAGEITCLRAQMRAQDGNPPGEGHLARVARLNALRKQAEEIVLAALVLLPPEPVASEDDPAAPASAGVPEAAAAATRTVRLAPC